MHGKLIITCQFQVFCHWEGMASQPTAPCSYLATPIITKATSGLFGAHSAKWAASRGGL